MIPKTGDKVYINKVGWCEVSGMCATMEGVYLCKNPEGDRCMVHESAFVIDPPKKYTILDPRTGTTEKGLMLAKDVEKVKELGMYVWSA